MNRLKIGIMPREQFQRQMVDIAAGKTKVKRAEPKVWFSSMKSLSEVLSDNNVRLLKLINPPVAKKFRGNVFQSVIADRNQP